MNENFYNALENRFRGTRSSVLQKLKIYEPFLEALKEQTETQHLLDLGCGRGEWLEFAQALGYEVEGIDLDAGMIEEAKILNLRVVQADILTHMQSLPDQSFTLISGFHIVEHLSFDKIHLLIQQALRILKDGGLLILETPNPENILVSSNHFYLDPTHIKPLPSKLLEFLVQFSGFTRTKVIGLNQENQLIENRFVNILQLLGGVSPDYAVIAQKLVHSASTLHMDRLFEKNYGLSLDDMALKFEHRQMFFEECISSLSKTLQLKDQDIQTINIKAEQAIQSAQEANQSAQEANQSAQEANQSAQEAWKCYYEIINSKSWRVTFPLRWLNKKLIWFKTGVVAWMTFSPNSRPYRISKYILIFSVNYIVSKPRLKRIIIQCIDCFPTIKQKLKLLITDTPLQVRSKDLTLQELSPRAKEIYFELKSMLKDH